VYILLVEGAVGLVIAVLAQLVREVVEQARYQIVQELLEQHTLAVAEAEAAGVAAMVAMVE
jgi:hypothetical protein